MKNNKELICPWKMWMNSINGDLHLIKEKRNVTFDPQFYFLVPGWNNMSENILINNCLYILSYLIDCRKIYHPLGLLKLWKSWLLDKSSLRNLDIMSLCCIQIKLTKILCYHSSLYTLSKHISIICLGDYIRYRIMIEDRSLTPSL